jgi:hypothetical protein
MGLNACVITGRATSDAFTKAMPKGRLGRYSETKCRAPLTVRAHHCSCRESEPSVGVPGSPARFFTLSNTRRSFMRLPPQNNSTMRRTILRFRYRTFGKKKRSLRNTITDVWRLYNFVLSKQVALLIEGYNIFRVVERRGLVRTSDIETTELRSRVISLTSFAAGLTRREMRCMLSAALSRNSVRPMKRRENA